MFILQDVELKSPNCARSGTKSVKSSYLELAAIRILRILRIYVQEKKKIVAAARILYYYFRFFALDINKTS